MAFVLLTLVVVCGCRPAATQPTANSGARDLGAIDERVVELYGGGDGLEPVLTPTTVEACRIDPQAKSTAQARQVGGYAMIAGPVTVEAAAANELAGVLNDPRTYEWDLAKGCEFIPGVAVRFTRQSSTTEVLFCFDCDELVVYRNGQRVGGEDFDTARTRLVRIFRRVFPDDEAIQTLQ